MYIFIFPTKNQVKLLFKLGTKLYSTGKSESAEGQATNTWLHHLGAAEVGAASDALAVAATAAATVGSMVVTAAEASSAGAKGIPRAVISASSLSCHDHNTI